MQAISNGFRVSSTSHMVDLANKAAKEGKRVLFVSLKSKETPGLDSSVRSIRVSQAFHVTKYIVDNAIIDDTMFDLIVLDVRPESHIEEWANLYDTLIRYYGCTVFRSVEPVKETKIEKKEEKTMNKQITLEMGKVYIGKTLAAFGVEMSELIELFGGTGASEQPHKVARGKIKSGTLKACGLDLMGKHSGASRFILRDITFIVFHETMSRDLTFDAHEVTILGIEGEDGQPIDRDAYNRTLVELTKKIKMEQEKRMKSLLTAVCDF